MNQEDNMIRRLMDSTLNACYWRIIRFNHDGGNVLGQKWFSSNQKETELRILKEEVEELEKALDGLKKIKENGETKWVEANENEKRVEVADALGDIIYVALGTGAKLGIDMVSVIFEIINSNETKYDIKGKLNMVNGKIQKGDNFKAPNLEIANEVIDFSQIIEEVKKENSQKESLIENV